MHILHLAYEDPRQQGSGGGSVRTREINRRLSRRHTITAVVAGYPGARPRLEDGVRWLPVGPRTGTKLDRLAYFALAGREILRRPHDLVVDDFAAPFSVTLAPLFTRKPVVASVQWLFAREMRHKYRLPFDVVERAGLPLYGDFIAVSDWLAAQLRTRRPDAAVDVIPEGVDDEAYVAVTHRRTHLLFVGRLDAHQKGGDLLFSILARVRAQLGPATPPLAVCGDGPDRHRMEQLARSAGVADLVHFRGRVHGAAKFQLMADAYALLMPSRYETFGMVAAESQAAGGPVVAFDVGPLAEVAGGGGASLVAPFDLDAFADEVTALVREPARIARVAAQGARWAQRYRWDDIARRQEDHYLRAVAIRNQRTATGVLS